MNFFDAVILGLVQGLTEFIPISSSGHLIIFREFFGIHGTDLAVDAVLQLATVLAVIVYFFKELPSIVKNKRLMLALVFGTVPAVVFGILLESRMETVFRNIDLVAWALIAGAVIMYLAEKWGNKNKEIEPGRGLVVGLFQSLALIPGISRSGATIAGGLFAGISRGEATRFSFLLSVPVILGSGLKKLFDISQSGELVAIGFPLLIASIVAFLSGFWAIKFLINYLKSHKLTPFIWYRVILAAAILILA